MINVFWNYNLILTPAVASLQNFDKIWKKCSGYKVFKFLCVYYGLLRCLLFELTRPFREYGKYYPKWRSILVNINFYVIQFPLISVYLDKKMKIISLIFSFFYFLQKQFLKKAKYWSTFYHLDHFEILYWGKLCLEKIFRLGKMRKFGKNFHHFSPSVFFPINILVFSTSIKMYMVKQ